MSTSTEKKEVWQQKKKNFVPFFSILAWMANRAVRRGCQRRTGGRLGGHPKRPIVASFRGLAFCSVAWWEMGVKIPKKGCQKKNTNRSNMRLYCVYPLVLVGTELPDLNAHTIKNAAGRTPFIPFFLTPLHRPRPPRLRSSGVGCCHYGEIGWLRSIPLACACDACVARPPLPIRGISGQHPRLRHQAWLHVALRQLYIMGRWKPPFGGWLMATNVSVCAHRSAARQARHIRLPQLYHFVSQDPIHCVRG